MVAIRNIAFSILITSFVSAAPVYKDNYLESLEVDVNFLKNEATIERSVNEIYKREHLEPRGLTSAIKHGYRSLNLVLKFLQTIKNIFQKKSDKFDAKYHFGELSNTINELYNEVYLFMGESSNTLNKFTPQGLAKTLVLKVATALKTPIVNTFMNFVSTKYPDYKSIVSGHKKILDVLEKGISTSQNANKKSKRYIDNTYPVNSGPKAMLYPFLDDDHNENSDNNDNETDENSGPEGNENDNDNVDNYDSTNSEEPESVLTYRVKGYDMYEDNNAGCFRPYEAGSDLNGMIHHSPDADGSDDYSFVNSHSLEPALKSFDDNYDSLMNGGFKRGDSKFREVDSGPEGIIFPFYNDYENDYDLSSIPTVSNNNNKELDYMHEDFEGFVLTSPFPEGIPRVVQPISSDE